MEQTMPDERKTLPLATLAPGDSAIVLDVVGAGAFRRRLLEMGFVKGVPVHVIKRAPLNTPTEYCIGGTHVTLRRQEAMGIIVEQMPPPAWCPQRGPRHGRRRRLGLGRGRSWRHRRPSE
jgi:ferrous iron transport protein A